MKLLFNKGNAGKTELKAILGFLDGDFNYTNIEPDIKMNTPYLVDLVGQAVYDKIEAYYDNNTSVTDADEVIKHKEALSYMQIYIASMAYLDYSPNNDLVHTNAGRTFRSEENEKIPWEWQINADNAAMKKRAYKALDLLFLMLDSSGWVEWTNSNAAKKAASLFIKNTKQFDAVFPINKSGQLYYRLVPFMDDFETYNVEPILNVDKITELKNVATPDEAQKVLINLIQKALAYLSLGRAYKVFPVEMFPDGLVYNENTRMKSESRAEVMQFLNTEGEKYLQKLEYEYSRQNETFTERNTMPGLEAGTKYVNL